MAEIRPLRGLRPRSDRAHDVLAPPYDVLSEPEARQIVARQPGSFLRVTRPEVNLPVGVDPHGPSTYAAGRQALSEMMASGLLVRDEAECFYLYAQRMGDHHQEALMALCSVDEYDRGAIKKHEHTRPDKEQDRVDHITAVGAQTGLVFLTYRAREAIARRIEAARPEAPLYSVTTDDGVTHTLSRIDEPEQVAALREAFRGLPTLYIADGHHRSAAASRVSAARGGGAAAWFLAGLFPDDQLQVMAYNRLVADLGDHSPAQLLAAINEQFEIEPDAAPVPVEAGSFTMYLEGRWSLLRPRPGVVDDSDPVASLDVAVLQDRVLSPLLGIHDPRRDSRVAFVGGIRGHAALSAAVDAGEAAVAFHMVPTPLQQLFAVADADRVMPPKSTWFEPKLRGGVLVNLLD